MLPSPPDMKVFWDKHAEFYGSNTERFVLPQGQSLFNMMPFKEGFSTIEVGCGTGMLSCQSAQNIKVKSKYLAIDFSDEMIKIANERKKATLYDQNLVQLEFKSANAEDLSFLDSESIDAYISPLCFHLVNEPKKMLQEAFRVMKKGARFALSIPQKKNNDMMNISAAAIQEIGSQSQGKPQMKDPFVLCERDIMINIVKEAGFEVDIFHTLHFPIALYSAEEYLAFLKDPLAGPCTGLDDKQKEKYVALISEEFEKRKKEYKAVGLDCILVFGRKP